MLKVYFDYPISDKQIVEVVATCKSVLGGETVEGLSLQFLDEDKNPVKISYDKELFEDLEHTAIYMLAEEYYNPSLNFSNNQRH